MLILRNVFKKDMGPNLFESVAFLRNSVITFPFPGTQSDQLQVPMWKVVSSVIESVCWAKLKMQMVLGEAKLDIRALKDLFLFLEEEVRIKHQYSIQYFHQEI